jgi:hypothetical protein
LSISLGVYKVVLSHPNANADSEHFAPDMLISPLAYVM